MNNQVTFSQLQDLVKTFCKEREWDQYHNAKDLAIGIITESSELLEYFRFKSAKEVEEIMRQKKGHVSEELADILFFILRFAQRYNIDLRKEFLKKMEKNNKKYPIDKSKGSNKKYTEYK